MPSQRQTVKAVSFHEHIQQVDSIRSMRYSERMKKKSSTAFVVGAKPPEKLSAIARKQLANLKPSATAQKLAENAARALGDRNWFSENNAAAASARTPKKSTSAK